MGRRRVPAGLQRSLAPVVAALVALVAVVLLAAGVFVLTLGRIPRADEQGSLAAAVVAAIAAALAFGTLRARVSRVIRGSADSAERTIRALPSRLTRALPMDELLLQVAEALRASLRLDAVEVWVRREVVFEQVASIPNRPRDPIALDAQAERVLANAGQRGATWARVWAPSLAEGASGELRVLPLIDAGELLGFITLGSVVGSEVTAEAELDDLARALGLALRNARLDSALEDTLAEVRRQADELRDSRARLVDAADGERRRIERNIHDGAQQQIVALLSKLGLAGNQLRREPSSATATIAELQADAARLLDDLRELAQGIHPSVLTDRGLLDAIEAQASRLPIGVLIEATADMRGARFPPSIEGAAYFLVAEALANVLKHSGAGRAIVRLACADDSLNVSVHDDGAGFDTAASRGSGLVGLVDRIEAVGGILTVVSEPLAGTTVAATLPVGEGQR